MNYRKNTIMKLWLSCILMTLMVVFFHPNHSDAISGLTIDPDSVEYVKINTLVMEVNSIKSYMIAGEIRINISEFKVGNKAYKTSLLDKSGNAVKLNSFIEGQRVLIKGFELPDGVIMAEIIQEVSASEKPKRNK